MVISLRVHKLRHLNDEKPEKAKGSRDEDEGGVTASEQGSPKKKRKSKKKAAVEKAGKISSSRNSWHRFKGDQPG